ncbi:para-aminobenzoate synthetase/4-amino-4-deoxychorismate lyase [Actimicrobium sp. GrIS 1.19]|uniref:bifunctional anthranilate synthase component I family protein/class IV aminotransferase n=1 Tax=Actimicrobium sp. GrIS 1.19 TaxID=3071708 RepID=UPI002DF81593|nr:para-aminobenzoate synthetase/4-amino-4-deoxychorismate lyase [Actimicrobium sp. GrIS 1.19]
MPAENSDLCYALLDDADASAVQPRSRLYTGYLRTLICHQHTDLPQLLDQLQQTDTPAVLLMSYELGAALQGIAPHTETAPLAQVLLFARCELLDATQVGAWLAARSDAAPAGVANLRNSVTPQAFEDAIGRIRALIQAGDTYQVNYTYRVRFDAFGTLPALYARLRARQPVPYGALIALPDGSAVLSLSPELFITHRAGELLARPMKGTAAASGDAARDALAATELASDPKNRAENLMIVDLLRNDLGRVAVTGSVAVPQLFAVTRYADLLQMTSTVTAQLRADVTLTGVIDALYPCGSITGAPKHRTMQIIRALEPDPRGLYTGAIGWFDPATAPGRIGDFCLSVPIRTLVLQPPGTGGVRAGEMGVGAGIVHDSEAASEFAECRLKAGFLAGMPNTFALFETMAVSRADGCALLERHLHRLAGSARYFGFSLDEAGLCQAVAQACATLPDAQAYRLRLALEQDGRWSIQTAPVAPWPGVARLLLATRPTASDDLFLRHKTTHRNQYDAAWREAEAQGAFDMLFYNERGEITEGARSNLFAQIDGAWLTPPLSAGVLPGVMRARLLDDPAWAARESSLTRDDLQRAQRLVVCNALRGVLPAQLLTPGY